MKKADTAIVKTGPIARAVMKFEENERRYDCPFPLSNFTFFGAPEDKKLMRSCSLNDELTSWKEAADSVIVLWDYRAGRISAEQAGIPF